MGKNSNIIMNSSLLTRTVWTKEIKCLDNLIVLKRDIISIQKLAIGLIVDAFSN